MNLFPKVLPSIILRRLNVNNTIADLNNYLFEQMERLNDDDLTDDELERELKKTDRIVKVSETIISNAELALKAIKHADEYGYGKQRQMPRLLMPDGDKK